MPFEARPGESSPEVRRAQGYLNLVLLSSEVPESGEYDRRTQSAVRQFQRESGMRQTGVLDDALLAVLAEAAQRERPTYQIHLGNRTYLMSDRERTELVRNVGRLLQRQLARAQASMAGARAMWETLNRINDRQYVVSYIAQRLGGTRLPPEAGLRRAEAALDQAVRAARSGNIADMLAATRRAEALATSFLSDLRDYQSSVITGGDRAATGLTIVSGGCFSMLTVMAAPVVASWGAGAAVTGFVAAAGTEAVQALAEQVGEALDTGDVDIPEISRTVLQRSVISGLVGTLTSGAIGEDIMQRVAGSVAARGARQGIVRFLRGGTAQRWIECYLRRNGARIINGIVADVIDGIRDDPGEMTVTAFVEIVARQVLTAGILRRFEQITARNARSLVQQMSSADRQRLVQGFGPDDAEGRLREVVGGLLDDRRSATIGAAYEEVVRRLTGDEEPDEVTRQVERALARDRAFLREVEEGCRRAAR